MGSSEVEIILEIVDGDCLFQGYSPTRTRTIPDSDSARGMVEDNWF